MKMHLQTIKFARGPLVVAAAVLAMGATPAGLTACNRAAERGERASPGGQQASPGGRTAGAGGYQPAPASLAQAMEDSVPQGYKALQNPIAPGDAAAVAAGQQLAVQHCVVCHAADFRGMQLGDVHSGDLTQSAGTRSDQFLMWAISAGSQRGMPPWERPLSAEKRWQLVAFIKSLKR